MKRVVIGIKAVYVQRKLLKNQQSHFHNDTITFIPFQGHKLSRKGFQDHRKVGT